MTEDIQFINPFDVTFLIRRERDPQKRALIKEAIRELGVIQPLHVRDITDWPAAKRRKPDGGLYKWEAIFGQGRTELMIELYEETQDPRFLRLPAIVKQVPEGEIVGRFLAENILRRDLPWLDQARLIRAEVEHRLASAPKGTRPQRFIREIAQHYFLTEGHAAKLLRILQQASPKIERQLEGMTVAEAETLTSLPQSGQEIVIETLQEEGLERSQIPAIVRKAREVAESGAELSKTALRQSLKRVGEDLSRQRESLKLARLHHSLGAENLKALISDKDFRKRMDAAGINYNKFAEAMNS